MRKIVHMPDSSFYSELISVLDFDNNSLIYNEFTDEMFRFVMPTDVNQTFDAWKGNLPKYTFQRIGGGMTITTGLGDLSSIYGLYDTDDIFASELSPYFMLQPNIYWQKKIGGTGDDLGFDIVVDGSGNVYLNGKEASDSYGGTDYGVAKLDSSGTIIWQKKIGGSGEDVGLKIAVDSYGNVYVNGNQRSDDYGSSDYGVIKLDSNGNELWQKKIGGTGNEYGQSIAVDSYGNVYVTGLQTSDSYGGYDMGVVKLDTNGNLLWQKKIGLANNDVSQAIAVDSSGNVYLNGYQTSDVIGGTYDYGIVKLDSSGNIIWQKKIGGASDDFGRAIKVDGNGNIYLNGQQKSDSYGDQDYGVIKLNSSGTILWQKKIGGTGLDGGLAIDIDPSGNIYLNGVQPSDSYGLNDYGVVKLDSSGNLLWQKKIGGISTDYARNLAIDQNNNLYVCGRTNSDIYGYGNFDIAVVKLYSNGNVLFQKKIGGPLRDVGQRIIHDGENNILLTATQLSDSFGGRDIYFAKIGDVQSTDLRLSVGDSNLLMTTAALTMADMDLTIFNLEGTDKKISIDDNVPYSIENSNLVTHTGEGLIYR